MNRLIHTPRIAILLGTAALALAAAGGAQAADKKYEKQTAVVCNDGSNATDKTGCEKSGGIKGMQAQGAAVQTESAKVSSTGQAPTTGLPTKTPAKPDAKAK